MSEQEQARWYGVSYGNGNDGVSQIYPSFYVFTSDPYRAAELAMVAQFKAEWKARAAEAVIVDGEAEYTVAATIYDPLDAQDDRETELDVSDAAGRGATPFQVRRADQRVGADAPASRLAGVLVT